MRKAEFTMQARKQNPEIRRLAQEEFPKGRCPSLGEDAAGTARPDCQKQQSAIQQPAQGRRQRITIWHPAAVCQPAQAKARRKSVL